MKITKTLAIAVVPLMLAAGCAQMAEGDRAKLDAAAKNSADAKSASMSAAAQADAAAKAAQAAADAAARAAKEAKDAADKADRIFQRNLRK